MYYCAGAHNITIIYIHNLHWKILLEKGEYTILKYSLFLSKIVKFLIRNKTLDILGVTTSILTLSSIPKGITILLVTNTREYFIILHIEKGKIFTS